MTARLRRLPTAEITWEQAADVVVIGGGAAGMSAALEAASWGRRVLIVAKSGLGGGATPMAQGGLAAVLAADDSTDLHHVDTAVAGRGLCDDEAVSTLVAAAPAEIGRLTALGARFDTGPLGLEGGHSRRRIVHAGGDASGAEVHRVLSGALAASGVDIIDDTAALDVLVDDGGHVIGLRAARVVDPAGRLEVGTIHAPATVIATGGYGQAYVTTTNPVGATGDGLAIAARAGAELIDLEFVQFHPTVLWRPEGRGRQPLITEALRGAGAVLVDLHGLAVMAEVDPLAELAPRDVVTLAMHRRMTVRDDPSDHLFLDATRIGRRSLEAHFPTVTSACRAVGLDPAAEPIPVAPGAHYACGGIRANMVGETSLEGLYAVGEAASTGVHGANRLASNSLTEAMVTGRRLGRLLGRRRPSPRRDDGRPPSPGAGVSAGIRDSLVDAMSRHCGVIRDGEGLEHLLGVLAVAPPAARGGPLDLATVEATNLHTVSTLVAVAALARTESRGCHRRSDFPQPRTRWAHRQVLRSERGEIFLQELDRAVARV